MTVQDMAFLCSEKWSPAQHVSPRVISRALGTSLWGISLVYYAGGTKWPPKPHHASLGNSYVVSGFSSQNSRMCHLKFWSSSSQRSHKFDKVSREHPEVVHATHGHEIHSKGFKVGFAGNIRRKGGWGGQQHFLPFLQSC